MRAVEIVLLVLAIVCLLLSIIFIYAGRVYEDERKDFGMFCLSLSSLFFSLCALINALTT